jgi:aspartate-semialdehyde dehydrogenase
MRKPVIAIAGATGLVGSEMMQCLVQLGIRFTEVRLLASKDSAGELYQVGGEEVQVQELDASSFDGCGRSVRMFRCCTSPVTPTMR